MFVTGTVLLQLGEFSHRPELDREISQDSLYLAAAEAKHAAEEVSPFRVTLVSLEPKGLKNSLIHYLITEVELGSWHPPQKDPIYRYPLLPLQYNSRISFSTRISHIWPFEPNPAKFFQFQLDPNGNTTQTPPPSDPTDKEQSSLPEQTPEMWTITLEQFLATMLSQPHLEEFFSQQVPLLPALEALRQRDRLQSVS